MSVSSLAVSCSRQVAKPIMQSIASLSAFTLGTAAVGWFFRPGNRGSGSTAEGEILSILRAQLDRCGPEALHGQACPPCEVPVCPDSAWTFILPIITVICAGLLGYFFGTRSGRQGVAILEDFRDEEPVQLRLTDDGAYVAPRGPSAGSSSRRLPRR